MPDVAENEKPSLIGMITDPQEQFRRIRNRPIFFVALIIITIMIIIGVFLSFRYVEVSDEVLIEIAEESGEVLDEEMEFVIEFAQNIGVLFGGILGPIFGILITSLLHLLVAKIVHSKIKFRQLFSMNTYITFITAIGVLFNGILIALFQTGFNRSLTSLGIFFDPDSALGAMADHFEIFGIWGLILTAIGLQKVAKFSNGLAWGVPIVMFVIGLLFGIG